MVWNESSQSGIAPEQQEEADNPFEGYGKIVTGDRLIGRAEIVGRLASRMRRCVGSVALVGLPRIGKSSVARAVADETSGDEVVVPWVNIGALSAEVDLFFALGEEIRRQCAGFRPIDPNEHDGYGIFSELRYQCQELRDSGMHVVAVLDEFDAIKDRPDASVTIRRLRELIYEPDRYGVCVIIASRRPLNWIEMSVPDLSTLSGVCQSEHLRPLPREAWHGMLDRGGTRLRDSVDADALWSITGGHPYLSEMMLHECWHTPSIEEAEQKCQTDLDAYFFQVVDILQRDGLIIASKILEPSEIQDHLPHLRALGIIEEGSSEIWSRSFAAFIRSRSHHFGPNEPWSTDPG